MEHFVPSTSPSISTARSNWSALAGLAVTLLAGSFFGAAVFANARLETNRTTRALEHVKQEEFHEMVSKELKRSYDLGDENLEHKRRLIGAMRLVLSKASSSDGIFRIEYGELRPKLEEFEASVFNELIDEASSAISDSQESTNVKATYVTILDNMLTVMEKRAPDYKAFIARINELKIEFDGPLRSYFFNGGKKMTSPSARAEKMLPQKG